MVPHPRVERMGNYRKAIETILSRAKHRDEAVTEAVRERGGDEKCGGGEGREGRESVDGGGEASVLVQCRHQQPEQTLNPHL